MASLGRCWWRRPDTYWRRGCGDETRKTAGRSFSDSPGGGDRDAGAGGGTTHAATGGDFGATSARARDQAGVCRRKDTAAGKTKNGENSANQSSDSGRSSGRDVDLQCQGLGHLRTASTVSV